MLTLGCLAAAIIEGGRSGWISVVVLAAFAAALIGFALFLGIEWRAPQPMLPLSLFSRPLFSVASAAGLMVNVAFYGLMFLLSLYFQQLNGLSPFGTGMAFVPMLAAILITNLVVPRITPLLGAPRTVALGAAIMAAACVALLTIGPRTPYSHLLAQLIALGAGVGLLVPPLTSMLLGSVDKSRSGIASGVLNSMRQVGSVIGVALFGSLASAHQLLSGLRISLAISALILSASAATCYTAREQVE